MTAVAADVTQGQGAGVAVGDHHARGALDVAPGAGQCRPGGATNQAGAASPVVNIAVTPSALMHSLGEAPV